MSFLYMWCLLWKLLWKYRNKRECRKNKVHLLTGHSVDLIWIFCCSVYLRGNIWRENGGSCFIICTHPQGMWYAWDRGRKGKKFWWGSPKERDHSEDQGVEGRMESQWVVGRLAGCVNWIRLAQDRDRWRAIVISRWIYIDRLISTRLDGYI
jgi:hypothetical protein